MNLEASIRVEQNTSDKKKTWLDFTS